MNDQTDLFARRYHPERRVGTERRLPLSSGYTAPRQRHSSTSIEAGDSIIAALGKLQARVLYYVQACDRGATDEEMQANMDMGPNTQRPRRVELMQQGLIYDSGQTRPTKSGRNAHVWTMSRRLRMRRQCDREKPI
jgi:hypothetical protein